MARKFWIPAFAGMTCILFPFYSFAQGFLPRSSTTTIATPDMTHPLLIGETVPETIAVKGDNGKNRTLLSYKAPTELLVVAFLSPRCEMTPAQWAELRRLNDRYKDWRVSFVAVSVSSWEILPELSRTLEREKLPWPAVHDDQKMAGSFLKVAAIPELLIFDEYGVLKYRGPVSDAPKALNVIIGHIDTVPNPEPPFEGKCAL